MPKRPSGFYFAWGAVSFYIHHAAIVQGDLHLRQWLNDQGFSKKTILPSERAACAGLLIDDDYTNDLQ
jgi:hypothetical protein